MVDNVMMVVWSFAASVGFGLLFRLTGFDLFFAGLGGAIARAVLLLGIAWIPNRFVFTFLAALAAAFYAEYFAVHRKIPSTVFLYPTIIPLIPADLLYHAMTGLVLKDIALFSENAVNLALGLSGLCVGFVVSSTIAYYTRQSKAKRR